MTAALPRGFEFSEASSEQVEEAFTVMEKALTGDEVWVIIIKDCNPSDVHPWFWGNFGPRWQLPDIRNYIITDIATGKIVAWTALQFPWKITPSMTEELKALTQSHELPPLVPGMNVDALLDMVKMLGIANDYDYDPEHDYHRKGTMVLPEFQKRGFGTYLTRHCNAISDKSGDRTWLPSRPNSIHMFKNEGFKIMGTLDSHIERYGGSRRDSITYAVCRDPVSA